MKVLVCVIAAFAALQFVGCYTPGAFEDSDNIEEMSIQDFQSALKGRDALNQVKSKIDSVCPGYGNKLDNITLEIAACAETINVSQETLCSIVKNHVKRCVNPLISMYEECLPTQAKQLPAMTLNMIISATNHLCKTDGEHIFEFGNYCIMKMNDKTQRCLRRITTKFEQYQSKESLPSAQDICEFIESLRPCLQSHLNASCRHPITKESYLQLFDSTMKVCKNYEKNEIEVIHT